MKKTGINKLLNQTVFLKANHFILWHFIETTHIRDLEVAGPD